MLKKRKNPLGAETLPLPWWGSLQCSPYPLAGGEGGSTLGSTASESLLFGPRALDIHSLSHTLFSFFWHVWFYLSPLLFIVSCCSKIQNGLTL